MPDLNSAHTPPAPLPTYQFDGFNLRPAEVRDLKLAREWTLGDPDHRETTNPTFWIEQGSGNNSYLLEDAKGPVFFFKMLEVRLNAMNPNRWLEVHIQFTTGNALTQVRSRRGLVKGCQWLETILRENGFTGLYFYSKSPQLIYFCQNRLGFEWDGVRILKKIRGVAK